MHRVPVVDKNSIPLMPTKPSKARKLVRDGKAVGKFNKLGVYYIQLTFEPSGRETQPIVVGNDPGKKYTGIGVQSKKFTLFTAHLFLPFDTVKKRMEQRAMMRRSRRGRRINRQVEFSKRAHRQCRFSNRRSKKIPPSIRSSRQLEISVIGQLSKIYPISTIVYEYVKADVDLTSGRKGARSGKGFSPVMVGQAWAIEQLSKIAPVVKKFGWQTSNLKKHLGLKKQKHSKADAIPQTHSVDGVALAASQFVDYLPFENSQGRGHCWQGKVKITFCSFFVIRRPPVSRRQLHLMMPSKGGERRKYGGTITPFGIRKGDLVRYKDKFGYCSGYTGKSISVSDANWKRLGRYAASKVELVMRSTNLICKNIIGGAQFPYAQV
jgi:RRXRR protein